MEFDYIKKRLLDPKHGQLVYFDNNAIKNQKKYRALKQLAIVCNILTTFTIALAFTVPEKLKVTMGIITLILSTIVLATYQWEEFQNYGAKWEKFRLVAEQIKSEISLFEYGAGRYSNLTEQNQNELFVEIIEGIIKGTDISYFSLMVEPGKRIEKRLESPK